MGCQLAKLGRRCCIYIPNDIGSSAAEQHQREGASSRRTASKKHKGDTDATSSTAGLIKASLAAQPQPKAKLDRKDFMFMQLKCETKVKLPGTINGQQFIIDGCQDCELFVMDACAMVTIDDCKNCRIFIGPTESSIFIRDCSNCQFACITRQLRTRDCHACDILLYTRTRPIIESSSAVGVGCFCTPYAGLAQQMHVAQLSPFHNFWCDVFDFTPDESSAVTAGQQSSKHWHLLPAGTSLQEHMGSVPDQVLKLLQQPLEPTRASAASEAAVLQAVGAATATASPSEVDLQAVLCTTGQLCDAQQTAEGCFAFLLFPPGQQSAVLQWVAARFPCPVPGSTPRSNSSTPAVTTTEGTAVSAAAAAAGAAGLVEGIADVEDITLDAIADTSAAADGASNLPAAVAASAAATVMASIAECDPMHLQQPVLLRANEATIPADTMRQMATAAGWTQGQVKQLNAACTGAGVAAGNSKQQEQQHACCVGLEVQCFSVQQQVALFTEAATLEAMSCSSMKAAALFRNVGTTG